MYQSTSFISLNMIFQNNILAQQIRKFLLILVLLASASSCVGCSTIISGVDVRLRPQNGWVSYDDQTIKTCCKYHQPSITAGIYGEEYKSLRIIAIGPPLIPIIPNLFSKERSYTLILLIENVEKEMVIDIRDIKVLFPDGITLNYTKAVYCPVTGNYNPKCNQQDFLGPVTLDKGKYRFELTFQGYLNDGESSIDLSSVAFDGKSNQLPPLLVSKATKVCYSPFLIYPTHCFVLR